MREPQGPHGGSRLYEVDSNLIEVEKPTPRKWKAKSL